jgi:hypothetical protein
MTISTIDHAPTSLVMDHDRHVAIDIRYELPHILPEVQQREALDETRIRAYAALYREGHTLGEIMVFQEGPELYVADGFHRIEAAIQAGLDTIAATIRPGTLRDAVHYACGCNLHGVPLTQADKRRRVMTMLADPEWQQWSDREIARYCGVSHVFVAKLRKALTGNVTSERTYRTKHGTQATMDTTAIGKHTVPDVSGDASTPRVSHLPAGTTHTAEGAAGASPTEVIAPALQRQEEAMPTPVLADALSQVTDRQDPLAATEGLRHDGSAKAAEEVHTAYMPRHVPLCDALEGLATLPALDLLIIEMPASATSRIDRYLDEALSTLRRFASLWKKHRHEVPEVPGQPKAPKRGKQLAQGKTRRKPKAKTRQPAQTAYSTTETAPSQPDILLAAIHKAPQPLTRKDLRQTLGVDGSRLKRNLARLVAQGKIQEMPGGTFCSGR